jgi:hypothetical protein
VAKALTKSNTCQSSRLHRTARGSPKRRTAPQFAMSNSESEDVPPYKLPKSAEVPVVPGNFRGPICSGAHSTPSKPLKWWHPCVTAPLSPLMLAMLKAAEEGSLKRRGWNVTIDGQHASVVTLHKLQQRGLIRLVRITDDGRRALEYDATGKIDGEVVWTSLPR